MRPDPRLLMIGLLLAGCAPPQGQQPTAPAAPVTAAVVHPERRSLSRVVEQPGTVMPDEQTELFARASGTVVLLKTDIGKKVQAGEVLAELEAPELVEEEKQKLALVRQSEAEAVQARKALASSEAAVNAAEAMLVETKAGITRAQANYDRWESEMTRISGLVQRGLIDRQTGDETRNQFKAAEASRDEARARVTTAEALARKSATDRDKAEADIAAAEARVEVAKAEARRLAALVVYLKVRAPYAGVITKRRVNTGDTIHATAGKGEGLFTIARLDPVRLVVNVPEAEAGLVREDGPVKLTVPALKGQSLSGKVTRTSWALETGARTLRTEIDMPNSDGKLRPGMYVYAHLTGPLPEEWTLPAAAVVKQGDAMVCFLVENGKAVRTPVQVGHNDGQFVESPRYQKAGSTTWVEWTGRESVAAKAVGLVDQQPIQTEPLGK